MWTFCSRRKWAPTIMVVAFMASVIFGHPLDPVGRADEFRVDSAIYLNNAKSPAIEMLTLFTEGLAYDFMLTGSKEIAILDPARGRVILLDPTRKQKTTLTTEEILEFTTRLQEFVAETAKEPEKLNPTFEEEFDQDANKLTLKSKFWIYEATCIEPKHQTHALLYRQFADWSARLNAVRPQNSPPPFARLKLNDAVVKKGLIPKTVERTVFGRWRSIARSDHLFVWGLSKTDRQRISTVSDYLVEFTPVGFQEYHNKTETGRSASSE